VLIVSRPYNQLIDTFTSSLTSSYQQRSLVTEYYPQQIGNFEASDTIAIKIKASTDMRLTINATGTLTNTNRSMQDLLDVTPANDYWVDGQGFNYDDSVF
jgi:hypothetical protein